MKTTINIPDALYRRAKILAARRGTTLKSVVLASLEKELSPQSPGDSTAAPLLFTPSEQGFPVLAGREGAGVSDDLVNRIREEEGI